MENKVSEQKTVYEQLREISNEVTKMQMYQACIHFAKNQVPMDIATVKSYLNGDKRNDEFAADLLGYFRACIEGVAA